MPLKQPVDASKLERIFDLLDIGLDAFAICEVENGCALRCAPLKTIVVHFVLKGCGSIEWSDGTLPIESGTMIVIPKHLPKQINGAGPLHHVVDADAVCPMADGLAKYSAVEMNADLVLGCGSLVARVGDGPSLLDSLKSPLAVHVDNDLLPILFNAMLAELAAAGVGTRAILSAIMKQIVVLLLREHLEKAGALSPLNLALEDSRLARAVEAMTGNPAAGHTLESLSRTAGMSRSRFSDQFVAAYGISPMQFLQSTRLNRAARLLQASTISTKAIASAVGYASRSHFSNAFQTRFGVAPSRYRDTNAPKPTQVG